MVVRMFASAPTRLVLFEWLRDSFFFFDSVEGSMHGRVFYVEKSV